MAASEARVWTALVAVQVLFGTLAVAGKYAFPDVAPLAVAAVRVAAAALVLLALERALVPRDAPRPRGRDLATLAGLSVLGVVLNIALFFEGLQRTSAIEATLLVTTIPPFTLLIALALRRETFRAGALVGILVAFAGVLALLGVDARALGGTHLVGNLLVVANSFLYSIYLVLSRPLLARYGPLVVVTRVFLFGAVLMALVGARALAATDFARVGASAWWAIAWIVVGPTVLAYALNNWALARVDSSTVAGFIPLQPFVAALLAVPLLGETLGWRTLGAGALILAGVVLSARAAHSRRAGKPT